MPYRGRFAPSPTGPLHFGSLVAALASYLDARANQGEWLLRIEDLDPLRESREAADRIIASLEAHGLNWEGPIRYQSRQHDRYHHLIQQLLDVRQAYPCPCSRRELKENGGYHPRHCRQNPPAGGVPDAAIRFALPERDWSWTDLLQGHRQIHTRAEVDDFVLLRKEGFFAYQLAVVADDLDQRISHVVRGNDLLHSTPFQLALYGALGAPPPRFLHLPVITGADGQKLSKQNLAPALNDRTASANLAMAFAALQHPLPPELVKAPPEQQLAWGETHWRRSRLPRVDGIPERSLQRRDARLPPSGDPQ